MNAYFHRDTYPPAKSQCLHGMPSFYVGMPMLIVRMGKILLFAQGAYFHSRMLIFTVKMDTYIHVNVGTGMPIFT